MNNHTPMEHICRNRFILPPCRHSRLSGSRDLDNWAKSAASSVRGAWAGHVVGPLADVKNGAAGRRCSSGRRSCSRPVCAHPGCESCGACREVAGGLGSPSACLDVPSSTEEATPAPRMPLTPSARVALLTFPCCRAVQHLPPVREPSSALSAAPRLYTPLQPVPARVTSDCEPASACPASLTAATSPAPATCTALHAWHAARLSPS